MFSKKLLAFCLLTIIVSSAHASIGGYISTKDKIKLLEKAVKAFILELDDITTSYYGAKTFALVKEPLPQVLKMDNCAQIQANYKPTASVDVAFNAFNTWVLLECDGKLHTDATLQVLRNILENEKSSVAEIRYAAELIILFKQPIPNPAKVSQLLQSRLKEDDSLQSLGHALHAASLLGNAGKFMHDRIEDIVVQADEVDGKLLQWEGGLTTTSLLVTGLLRLPGANPFTQAQSDKIANYLLTRKTVQTPRGVLALIEAAVALTASKVSPVSISIIGQQYVSVNKPDLKVQISDIFGERLKTPLTPVIAQSATRIADDVVVLAKQPLASGKNETEFILPLKLEPGYYRIVINAGSQAATIYARVLGPVSINSFEIGLTDSDGSSTPKYTKVSYPAKLDSTLQGDGSQHLVFKFSLSRTVHQAFVRLYSGKKEILFVAEADNNKVYKVEINLAQELSTSGTFEIELILGDSVIANPISWKLGSIKVNLGSASSTPLSLKSLRGPKPEIKHLFRPAEKRPPETVSMLFTALTAAPFLLLLILWGRIGINFKNFTPVAIPFHLGFSAILCLFTLFWLKLDMFVTCGWLIPIGGFTFLAGHKLLSHIAIRRKPEKADK